MIPRQLRSTLFPYTTLFRSIMAEIVAIIANTDIDLIDINMGCPAPKIVKNGEGAALMKNPKLAGQIVRRSEEHTSELQSRPHLVCRLLLEKKKTDRTSNDQC